MAYMLISYVDHAEQVKVTTKLLIVLKSTLVAVPKEVPRDQRETTITFLAVLATVVAAAVPAVDAEAPE